MKNRVIVFCIVMMLVMAGLAAGIKDEVTALIGWKATSFSSTDLESERDAKLAEQRNPVKGEFETTAQFEQRKKDASARITAINREYEQKIGDARAAHNAYIGRLDQRIRQLLAQSRESVEMSGTLGAYDADTQKYKVTIPSKTFDIVVPLDKAPSLKQNFSRYKLTVTRQ
ncbi:MAG: hypothetical protein U1B83_03655, partial [Candidatus Cloacimonadaceae bacterium]|nr:hypothetical protein [Candidatus Cloacimonadaceae bacterium]